MQKWEYAYIAWNRDEGEIYRLLQLVYLHPAENKVVTVQKKGLLSKTPDFYDQFEKFVIRLGQEGYEMVGVTATSVGGTQKLYEYWFKRPWEGENIVFSDESTGESGATQTQQPETWSL